MMGSKTNVDHTVTERRLRPIYASLDNGNNKTALQEAEKVLKKNRDNQCAKVLKALALFRLGKMNDCQTIMDQVRSKIPCDESTLQAMSICYREIHQPDKISEVYEAAVKADPSNEELLTHLFMSYVRLGDYKKQQQAALGLYKLKPKNPYYFWAVMSIVMQGIHGDEKLAKGVTLPLAERMVVKLVQGGKLEAEQEVQLYLMILDLQGKSEEMLSVLSSPLSSHLSSVPQLKAALFLKLEKFPEAADTYKELIQKDANNWAYYQGYMNAALKYQKPEECLAFFNNIINTSDIRIRAPHLAKIELLKRTHTEEPGNASPESVDLMYEYFVKFGEKVCVVGDLQLYHNLLTPADKLTWLQKIEEHIGLKPDQFPSDVQQMQRHIHLEQLRRICGLHHPPHIDENKQKLLVKRLCDLYSKGNELCPVQERLPTDFCPADTYILLATHLLHQLWCTTGDATHLYKAMALLESGLLSSPANFHLKILLVRTYLEAGLVGAADYVFQFLAVKHIQIDSLGYLHAPLLAPLGHLSQACTTLDHITKFFIANYEDSADHLTFAYKYGSFVKIQEFEELRERLKYSLNFATSNVDKMILELTSCDRSASLVSTVSNMHINAREDCIKWDLLRDNRDLHVVASWDPLCENGEDPRMEQETRACMLQLLAARKLVLRIVSAATEPDSLTLFSQLAADLKQLVNEKVPPVLEKFKSGGGKDRSCKLLVPMDAVERLAEAHYSEQLKTIANFVESLACSRYPSNECVQALAASPSLHISPFPETNSPVSFKNFLLRASTCSESLAIISAICCICAEQQRPGPAQKKNKKCINKQVESLSLNDDERVNLPGNASFNWRDIATMLTEKVQNLDAVLTEFEKYKLYTGLDKDDDVSATITKLGEASLRHSCRSLKFRAQITLKLLNDLQS